MKRIVKSNKNVAASDWNVKYNQGYGYQIFFVIMIINDHIG